MMIDTQLNNFMSELLNESYNETINLDNEIIFYVAGYDYNLIDRSSHAISLINSQIESCCLETNDAGNPTYLIFKLMGDKL